MGASLPRQLIRDHFGDEDKANGAFVEVVNPSNGKRIVVPLVDKGPAKRVIDRQGPTIDLTYAANQAVGGNGLTPVSYRIIGSNPFDDLVPGKSSAGSSEKSGGSEAEDPFAALIPKAPSGPPALTPRMADTLGAKQWTDPFDGTEVRRGTPVRLPSVKTVENETTFPLAIGPKRNDWQDAGNSFMSGVADNTVAMPQGMYSQAAEINLRNSGMKTLSEEELRNLDMLQKQRNQLLGDINDPVRIEAAAMRGASRDEMLAMAGGTAEEKKRIKEIDDQLAGISSSIRGRASDTVKAISQSYQDIADDLGKQRTQNKEFWGVDKDFQESFTGKLITAAGGLVPQALSSALPGIGFAAMQSQAFQLGMDDARETAQRTGQPFDPDAAFAYAMTNSFQQALLEKVGLNTVLGKGVEKAGKITFTTLRNRVVKSLLVEGGTEGWEGGNQDALANLYDIEKRNPFDLRKRGTEVAIGSILGAGLTTVTTVSQKLEQNAAEAQQKLADAVKAAAAAKAAADQAAARAAAAQTTTPPAAASAPQATTPPAQKYNPEKAGTFRDFSQIPAATAPAEGAPITQPTSDEELDAKIAEYQREEGDETAAAPASKIEADLREGDDRFAPNREGGFVDTEILGEVADYGRAIFRKGMDFVQWAGQMVKRFGEQVAPYLRQIFEAINGGKWNQNNSGSVLAGDGDFAQGSTMPDADRTGANYSISTAEDSRYLELAKDPEANREELRPDRPPDFVEAMRLSEIEDARLKWLEKQTYPTGWSLVSSQMHKYPKPESGPTLHDRWALSSDPQLAAELNILKEEKKQLQDKKKSFEDAAATAEKKRWDESKKVFIRFGDIPDGGRSKNHRDDYFENGVSVYEALDHGKGKFEVRPTVSYMLSGPGFHDRPLYVVSGKVIGRGSDGEATISPTQAKKVTNWNVFHVALGWSRPPEVTMKKLGDSIRKNTEAGFINADVLADIVDYGRTVYRQGIKFAEWSKQMVERLGQGISKVLRRAWDTINGGQLLPSARETGAARVPSSVTPIVRAPATTSQNLSGKRTWDFANPIGNLSRLYKGTADIFSETPGLEFLGRAILQHVDTARRYYGQMTTPFRKWSQRHTAGNRKAALVAFEGYFRENERNKPLANSIYAAANPAGRELIDLWKDAANETGAINQRNNLMVWDGNLQTFRPIGKVGPEYFPRMVKPEVLATLRNPTRNPKGWDALVAEMLAEGIIAKPEDAAAYASTVAESYRSNDHFGAIERARSLPLPSKAYDYSFETARRYLASWSERMAQVEAYGQKVGTEGKDLFDKAQAIAADQPTKDYIKRVQDRAYNVSLDSGIARLAASASTLATGLQLGNPATTLKNLISGMAFTGQAYGVRRTLGTLLNLKKTFDGINDAYEKGILIDDLMNIMADGEKAVAARPLQTFARVALNVSGFAASEVWVRGVNMVAARAMLRDALKANQKDPLSRRSLQYRGFFARLGLRSPQALLDENGTGPETDKYLRAAVNEVQGGYRFDQVPQFMDTPAGRFLFKYQKWGSQQLRHFARNVANPFVQAVSLGKLGNSEYIRVRDPKTGNVVTRRVPGAVMPMARYLLLLAAAGAATEELLKMLFGIPEKEASWGEALAKLDKDTAAGVGMIATKIWGYHLLVGSMGQLGNYLQMGRDVVARSRFKNPLDPPSVAPLKVVSDLMLDWWEQGTITPDNLDQFARTQLSMYRVGKQAAARVNDVFGGEFRGLQMETRRQDLQWLNGVSRRYNTQLGVQKNRTQFGRIGKSPQSPFRDGLKSDLLLGDTASARKRLNTWLAGMPPARQKMELTSLMASVRASQPVKAGYGSEAMRINFLSWSRENLSAADVQRVKAIDSTYRNTARAVGLMKDQTDISEFDLDEAMQKIRLKSGR